MYEFSIITQHTEGTGVEVISHRRQRYLTQSIPWLLSPARLTAASVSVYFARINSVAQEFKEYSLLFMKMTSSKDSRFSQ